jgi:hypothetical protein
MSRNLRARVGLSQDATDRLESLTNDYVEYALAKVDPEDQATVANAEMDARPLRPRIGLVRRCRYPADRQYPHFPESGWL